ncbi:MAG: FkbM family methyltransferase [Roseovarius sp.]
MISDLVIDAGMHRGEDTEFYLKKGFRVVGVEANPKLCELVAKQQKDRLSSGELQIVNAAVVETSGPTTFYINDQVSDWGTTNKSWVERNQKMGTTSREVTVQGMRFGEILDTYGTPYFLKIDIEGNDTLCLEGLRGRKTVPKYISIESGKTNWAELVHEFDLFRELGYSRFKIVNQVPIDKQVCPNPPKEGKQVKHDFKFGSSGLFGEEAPGRWLTRTEALLKYRWIFVKYAAVGNYGLIPNLHKRYKPGTLMKKLAHPGWYDTHARHR